MCEQLTFFSDIRDFCKFYREYVARITLDQMEQQTGIKAGTLSAWENKRSTNYIYIGAYYSILQSQNDRDSFRKYLPMGDYLNA